MAAYEGIAGYIATISTGDTVVDLEMDIPAGWTLVIAQPKGHGGYSFPDSINALTWQPRGNYYFISNVIDTQENAWGYCMAVPAEDLTVGSMPTTIVTSPLEAGTDTITVTLDEPLGAAASPAFVSRILAFSGIPAYSPNNGCPVAMQTPIFTTTYKDGVGFFELDPDDAIPLPRLVGFTANSPVFAQDIPFQEYPPSEDNLDPQFLFGTLNYTDVEARILFIASVMWDGTTPGYAYYTSQDGPPDPVGPEGSPIGLSADNGAFYFDAWEDDPGWVDLGHDEMGVALESRYAYMMRNGPLGDETRIGADYDAATGVWGDSGPQVDDNSQSPRFNTHPNTAGAYPFAPGSWDGTLSGVPSPYYSSEFPLGDPNTISSPVWPTMSFIEAIAAGAAGQRFWAGIA